MKLVCLVLFSVFVLVSSVLILSDLFLMTLFPLFLKIKADFTVQTKKDFLKYADECATELNVSPVQLAQYKANTADSDEDPASFCHSHCVMKKMDMFDDEIGLNPENVLKQIAGQNYTLVEDMKKVVNACIKETEDKKEDKCLWAASGGLCIKKSLV